MKETYTKKEVQHIMSVIMASLKESLNNNTITDTIWLKNSHETLFDYIVSIINE